MPTFPDIADRAAGAHNLSSMAQGTCRTSGSALRARDRVGGVESNSQSALGLALQAGSLGELLRALDPVLTAAQEFPATSSIGRIWALPVRVCEQSSRTCAWRTPLWKSAEGIGLIFTVAYRVGDQEAGRDASGLARKPEGG